MTTTKRFLFSDRHQRLQFFATALILFGSLDANGNCSVGWDEPLIEEFHHIRSIECTVLDSNRIPITGAQVCEGFRNEGAPSSKPLASTDIDGHFLIQRTTPHFQPLRAYIVAKGKVVELLDSELIGNRKIQIRTQDESDIRVEVYDENGVPIPNAKVAPHEMGYPYSARRRDPSPSAIELLQDSTDSRGRAKIRGADAKKLVSVQVSRKGLGTRTYMLPTHWNHDEPIAIRWVPSRGSLHCQVRNQDGSPVANASIVIRSFPEECNPLTIKNPTIFLTSLESTDAKGECRFENVPVSQVDLECRIMRGRGSFASRKGIPISENKTADVHLELPPSKKVSFSVCDLADLSGQKGHHLSFSKITTAASIFAFAYTEEDGIGEVELEEGEWVGSVFRLDGLSSNYVAVGPLEQKISIAHNKTPKPILPFYIAKGKPLVGTIMGSHLENLRDGIIEVSLSDDGKETKTYEGYFENDGRFQITLPSEIDDSKIERFAFLDFALSRKELDIHSRSPWVLEVKSPTKIIEHSK